MGGAGMAGGGSGGADAGAAPDSDCRSATFEDHQYWFCTNDMEWDEARTACQGAGGDLVSINDEPEQEFVVSEADGGDWLVGLNQKNASGSSSAGEWEWVDGSDLAGYENWGLSEPDDESCGALDGSRWRDSSCTNGENWICEVP